MLGCRGCEGHDVPKHLAAILARGGAPISAWRLFRSNAGVASCPEDSVVCNGNVPPKLNLSHGARYASELYLWCSPSG